MPEKKNDKAGAEYVHKQTTELVRSLYKFKISALPCVNLLDCHDVDLKYSLSWVNISAKRYGKGPKTSFQGELS